MSSSPSQFEIAVPGQTTALNIPIFPSPASKSSLPQSKIQLLLIESDPIAAAAVRNSLMQHRSFELIYEASSVQNAIHKMDSLRPDAIFIGVEMMDLSESEIAQLINRPASPLVVFATVHKEYAAQAYELGAADFIVKPLCDLRLTLCLKRLEKQLLPHRIQGLASLPDESIPVPLRAPSTRILIRDRKRTKVIEVEDIEWIGAAGDYTEIHVRGATHLLREPLSVLLKRLPADLFCRIHRSFIVNLSKVSGFRTLRNQDLLVRLKDKTMLRASRTFSGKLKDAVRRQCRWQPPSMHS